MSKDKESKAKELQKSLTKKFELAWHALENDEKTMVDDFCESYKEYLTVSKTERLCAAYTVLLEE